LKEEVVVLEDTEAKDVTIEPDGAMVTEKDASSAEAAGMGEVARSDNSDLLS
jgi:hypothetical protein